jgi:hypothetical protein
MLVEIAAQQVQERVRMRGAVQMILNGFVGDQIAGEQIAGEQIAEVQLVVEKGARAWTAEQKVVQFGAEDSI